MRSWYNIEDDGICHVCLAGAVMAYSLKACTTRNRTPMDYPEHRGKLKALNDFRLGLVKRGIARLGLNVPEGIEDIEIARYGYRRNTKPFFKDMTDLADRLESAGL